MGIPGTVLLDRYRIVRPFARGAASIVYLAFDEFATPYAVKLFPPDLAARADREYLISRGLQHPNLNPVLERVTVEGRPGVLTAFAPGEPLSTWVSHRGGGHFVAVWVQTLRALAHLHARGVVHRDLKPENVVVAPSTAPGRVECRLLDFDLAGPTGEVFREGVTPGTAGYLSPEAALGRPLTPAADLYGAGVLLYWGVTGELPFHGEAAEVLRAHVNGPVPQEPLLRRGERAGGLARVVLRLLEKDPADRYPDVASVLEDLPRAAELLGGPHAN